MNIDMFHRLHGGPVLDRNLAGQAARELALTILRGEFSPGDTLPDEASLGARLKVSRTVVREAVKVLSAKGLVIVRPRLGTRVMERSSWQNLDRDLLGWHQGIPTDSAHLRQLVELRRTIEPAAARLAAERRTDADLASMSAACAGMADGVESTESFVISDARFHSAVLKAAHNVYFDALESVIFAGLLASIRVTNPDASSNRSSLPLHEKVLAEVRAGHAESAAAAMAHLLEDASERLNAAFERDAGNRAHGRSGISAQRKPRPMP